MIENVFKKLKNNFIFKKCKVKDIFTEKYMNLSELCGEGMGWCCVGGKGIYDENSVHCLGTFLQISKKLTYKRIIFHYECHISTDFNIRDSSGSIKKHVQVQVEQMLFLFRHFNAIWRVA